MKVWWYQEGEKPKNLVVVVVQHRREEEDDEDEEDEQEGRERGRERERDFTHLQVHRWRSSSSREEKEEAEEKWNKREKGDMESDEGHDRLLFAIAKAWKGLQGELLVQGDGDAPPAAAPALTLRSFSHGCSLISPLFGCLGIAFKFAEKDYVAKVGFSLFLSSSSFAAHCFTICLRISLNGF